MAGATGLCSSSLGAAAAIESHEHGAHLTAWKAPLGDVIFTSKEAAFAPPKAIRGGVPICWPQFANYGPLGLQHGFARNSKWTRVEAGEGTIAYRLTYADIADEHKAMVPGPFTATVRHELVGDGNKLRTSLSVSNESETDFEFTAALHTYFNVGDIAKTKVTGCKGLSYLDAPPHGSASSERVLVASDGSDAVTFDKEVDRIYFDTPSEVVIHDGARGLEVVVHKEGFPDAVVWNPWVAKSQATGDLGDDEYLRFVCVESAAVRSKPTVRAGATWTAGHLLEVRRA